MAHKMSPGPAADSAFRTGMLTAVLVGLSAIGGLYWIGMFSPAIAGYALVLVFPLYLVVAASVLSVWLGYGADATDLRPVYREG